MAKIGRNTPCPCGSGRKYKHCCGDPLKEQPSGGAQRLDTLPPEIELALKRHEAQELIRTQQQGLGKPIIAAKVGEHQFVAVGDKLHYAKKWKFFSDFLLWYIKKVLNGDWGNAEIAKPIEERHPIMQWFEIFGQFQKSQEANEDDTYSAESTGVVYCYLGLAYNLYLLKHNVELQDRLIARLKDRKQFQGAYYELIIANCLIRAGFELELEDEADLRTKHCEFSAVSKLTGKKYWIECKMRGVSGLLGKTDVDGAKPSAKPTSTLTDHLRDALRKPAEDDRLILIDVNAPPMEVGEAAKQFAEMPEWVEAAGKQLDAKERDLKDDEKAYVFVTNMSFHRVLDGDPRGHAALAHGLGIPGFRTPGPKRLTEVWRNKQEHIDGHRILEAIKTYPNIPSTFDGSIPMTEEEAASRVEIGQRYFFEHLGDDGLLGKVTTATISEAEKIMYLGVTTEDGQSVIVTREISDHELANYKQYPDTFFGVYLKAARRLDDPYELFEWMVDCYQDTPKKRLLELVKDHPKIADLDKMDYQDLVLEICEGWTWLLVHSRGRRKSD